MGHPVDFPVTRSIWRPRHRVPVHARVRHDLRAVIRQQVGQLVPVDVAQSDSHRVALLSNVGQRRRHNVVEEYDVPALLQDGLEVGRADS